MSAQVLLSIGKVLRLNNSEISYILNLAGFNTSLPNSTSPTIISPILQHVLDRLDTAPSIILNAHWDIIAWNTAARFVFADFERLKPSDRNLIKLIFLNSRFQERHQDWQTKAKILLSQFRLSISDIIEDQHIARLLTQ